jgi:dihydroflavonol-4-reductase
MPKDLVVGATGLLGWNLTCQLLARGRSVRALVRHPEFACRMLPRTVDLRCGDLTRPETLAGCAEECEVVYHVAGLPEQWLADPDIFRQVNTTGTANLIAAVRDTPIRRFVHTSTAEVFATGPGEGFDESVIATEPKGTHYQRSKQEALQHLLQAIEGGLPAVSLHPAACYGPGPETSPGLNRSFQLLVKGKMPLLPPGGLAVVLASDVARGHILAAEQATPGSRYILSERYLTLQELATAVLAAVDRDRVPPTASPALARLVAPLTELLSRLTNNPPLLPRGQLHFLQTGGRPDAGKARRELGWEPTPLEDGIRQTLRHLRLLPGQAA